MALRIVYKDFNLSVQELLIDNNSLNIHHRNLEKLVTKFFKVKNALSPKLINYIFEVIQKKNIQTTSVQTFQVEEDPCNKIWHRNTLPWTQIMESCFK